jgi:hypothetical protein
MKGKCLKCSKKSQFEWSFASFIIVIIGFIIIAPIMLDIVNRILTQTGNTIGNMSGGASGGAAINKVKTTFINFWDWCIIIAYGLSLFLLLFSAFLVQTHPIFLIIYIIFGVLTFIFAPMFMEVTDKIYTNDEYDTLHDGITVTEEIPMINYLREYFGIILLGIYIISGVIMFVRLGGV